jgi:hypothetical protein
MSETDQPKPTRKQLAYLRALANKTGRSFVYPRTRDQASREIRSLRQLPASSPVERFIETADLEAETRARAASGAAAIQPHELEGYGSNCRWSQ